MAETDAEYSDGDSAVDSDDSRWAADASLG